MHRMGSRSLDDEPENPSTCPLCGVALELEFTKGKRAGLLAGLCIGMAFGISVAPWVWPW